MWSLTCFIFSGTSTDVSRYSGQYEHVFESTTAGITIQAPQVSVNFPCVSLHEKKKTDNHDMILLRGLLSSCFMFGKSATLRLGLFQLDINTVAAGGGSQLFFRSGMFVVGPESAGAHPGPVCYKKGK